MKNTKCRITLPTYILYTIASFLVHLFHLIFNCSIMLLFFMFFLIIFFKQHELYDSERCHGFVCDVADDNPVFPMAEQSLDIIVLIFVLSAIHPDR